MSEKNPVTKKDDKQKYKEYYWIDPVSKLGYARIYVPTDEFKKNGDPKYKPITKRAKNKTHAAQLAKEMKADYETRKTGFVEGERMNFNQAADWYIKHKVIPPKYSDKGDLIDGMATFETVRGRINRMRKFFGRMLIKTIDEDVLYRYKIFREKDIGRDGEKIKPATVNRDFEDLRAMFRVFVRRRWLKESPFDFGERVIEKALEESREVTLSLDEEFCFIECAKKTQKSLLYYVLLCLLDTGARPCELYDAATVKTEPVTWNSFFAYGFKAVKLISYKGRKRQVRFAPVTNRLEFALRSLWDSLPKEEKLLNNQIFQVTTFKKSWATCKREAYIAFKCAEVLSVPIQKIFDGSIDKDLLCEIRNQVLNDWLDSRESEGYEKPSILDVRLRDMRRHWSTFAARLNVEGDLRGKILGHEQRQTTFDYTHASLEAVSSVKILMDNALQNEKNEE